MDSESHVTVEKNGASSVTSSIKVILEREDLGAKIECHVDNDAIDEPLVSWVEIDLHGTLFIYFFFLRENIRISEIYHIVIHINRRFKNVMLFIQ